MKTMCKCKVVFLVVALMAMATAQTDERQGIKLALASGQGLMAALRAANQNPLLYTELTNGSGQRIACADVRSFRPGDELWLPEGATVSPSRLSECLNFEHRQYDGVQSATVVAKAEKPVNVAATSVRPLSTEKDSSTLQKGLEKIIFQLRAENKELTAANQELNAKLRHTSYEGNPEIFRAEKARLEAKLQAREEEAEKLRKELDKTNKPSQAGVGLDTGNRLGDENHPKLTPEDVNGLEKNLEDNQNGLPDSPMDEAGKPLPLRKRLQLTASDKFWIWLRLAEVSEVIERLPTERAIQAQDQILEEYQGWQRRNHFKPEADWEMACSYQVTGVFSYDHKALCQQAKAEQRYRAEVFRWRKLPLFIHLSLVLALFVGLGGFLFYRFWPQPQTQTTARLVEIQRRHRSRGNFKAS